MCLREYLSHCENLQRLPGVFVGEFIVKCGNERMPSIDTDYPGNSIKLRKSRFPRILIVDRKTGDELRRIIGSLLKGSDEGITFIPRLVFGDDEIPGLHFAFSDGPRQLNNRLARQTSWASGELSR